MISPTPFHDMCLSRSGRSTRCRIGRRADSAARVVVDVVPWAHGLAALLALWNAEFLGASLMPEYVD